MMVLVVFPVLDVVSMLWFEHEPYSFAVQLKTKRIEMTASTAKLTWMDIFPREDLAETLLAFCQEARTKSSSSSSSIPPALQCFFGLYTPLHVDWIRKAVDQDASVQTWSALVGQGMAIASKIRALLSIPETEPLPNFKTVLDYNLTDRCLDESQYHDGCRAFCRSMRQSVVSKHPRPVG